MSRSVLPCPHMKVACVIPVHNEAAVLSRAVQTVHAWGRGRFGDGFELVISENGSTDTTPRLAGELAWDLNGVSVAKSSERGKGGAIKRGMMAAEDADAFLMMDADLSTDLDSAERLIQMVLSGSDLVIGSRRMPDSDVERPLARRVITSAYAALADAVLDLGIRDLQCGCKAFSRRVRDEIVPMVSDDGWFFDTELLALAKSAGLAVTEVGVRWSEPEATRRESKVRVLTLAPRFVVKLFELRFRTPSNSL